MEVIGQASGLGLFTLGGKAPGTHSIRGKVWPGAGLDAVAKRKIPSPWWESNHGRSGHSFVSKCV